MQKPYLIAEIGINHNGSVNLAKKIIKIAKENNFNAVKFQKRDLEICIPQNERSKLRQTIWGEITYMDYKKLLHQGAKLIYSTSFQTRKVGSVFQFVLKTGVTFYK